MNVGELKRAIAELPDDMPVLIAGETGAGDEPNLYVIPANVTHHTYGSRAAEGYASPQTVAFYCERGELVENTSALLLSEWGNSEGEDITPRRDHTIIIDGEVVSG
ncbi:hypothetical protein I5G71_gp40 [Mycobacterium phage Patt]|uniref:Uncharacterized protein n=1 Tax=Mycobacterium phage Patt TaxID=2530139 RepID=A0A481VRI0_9CAUD|nr:hypothetical protein I5G71_gp40 [Mycobacterium phage Patt]QBI96273.1 hypothetical protein SEA_PATT_40 [Mycobacterium phage Patt]